MTDDLDLCPGCFLGPRTDGPCPKCAYQHDPHAFPTALQPRMVLTKYAVGRVLGRPGGFGITYLAFDRVLRRRVAMKELMPRELVARRPDGATVNVHTKQDGEIFKSTLASFLNEARLLAQFSHTNVVRVLDYFEANGTAYFVMEYLEGQTLAEYTQRAGGRLPGPEAVALMLPLLDALEHIHTQPEPLLHRDIKPANIYLADRRTPILLDFGAARVALGQQSRSLSAVLTPGFAPYEQYSTRGRQGPWTDVYGCAATLHYLVTGRVPREASERLDDPQLDSPRAMAPDLSPQLSDAIVAGLAFKPEARPQSAREFADLISGKRPLPLPATEREPFVAPYAPVGASEMATVPRSPSKSAPPPLPVQAPPLAVPPPVPLAATEIAPPTATVVTPPPVPPPVAAGTPASQGRPTASRKLLTLAGGVVVLVGATAWAAWLQSSRNGASVADPAAEGSARGGETPRSDPSTPEPPRPEPPKPEPPKAEPPKSEGPPAVARNENEPPSATDRTSKPEPGTRPLEVRKPEVTTSGKPSASGTKPASGAAAPANAPATPGAPPPVPPAPAAEQTAANGVLVVIRGEDFDAVQEAEAAILRSLVGRRGLQAVDADSLSMMRGDQSAVRAAAQGDFAGLAASSRQHGVELLVVGELRARAAPSVNRFFTGTAELTVRMYRVSNSRLVNTETFRVGSGGGQPVLAISEGEARARAAAQVAALAAEGVGSWLGRAF